MGQVLHGSATTTEAIRRAIQARQESVRAAAQRHGIARLPELDADKPKRSKFKAYPIGYIRR